MSLYAYGAASLLALVLLAGTHTKAYLMGSASVRADWDKAIAAANAAAESERVTHQSAIDAGDKVAGCSVHLVTAELDGGPVLEQTEVAILLDDSAETLAARVKMAEHQLYPRALSEYVSRANSMDVATEF